MPKPIIKIDADKLLNKMREYSQIVGEGVPKLVKREARLLCVELARQTQPFGNDRDAKTSGEAAIDVDFGKLFWSVDEINNRTRNETDLTGAYDWRRQNRRRTTGRFPRISPSQRKTVTTADKNTILTALKNKVGMAKGGWAAAAVDVGADVGNALRGFPAWVKRHAARKQGRAKDLTRNLRNPKVVLTNTVGYADKLISQSQIRRSLMIQKGKFMRSLNRALKYEYARRAGLNG